MIHFALSHNVMSHVTPVEGTEYQASPTFCAWSYVK